MATPAPSTRDRTPTAPSAPSPPAESIELPMSNPGYTTPNAPASEFGQLAIGSSSSGSSGARMTATTRSMSRRMAATSQNPSSRTTAGPSRRIQASAGARNTPSLPPSRSNDSDDDSDDSDSNDDDESDDDGNGDDNSRAQQEQLARTRLVRVNVFDIFALTEPSYLVGTELIAANGAVTPQTQLHQSLANVVARQAVASNDFYASLMRTVRVPGQTWSEMMLPRMDMRSRNIFALFDQNVQNPANGRDVINTATHLQRLVDAVSTITLPRYWEPMQAATRQSYLGLLMEIFGGVVERDNNPYDRAGVARPPYAGETTEHTNLYRRVIGNPNATVFVVPLLQRLDPDGRLLVGRVQRLGQIFAEVQRRHSVQSADGGRTQRSSPQPPAEFTSRLTQLYRAVYARAQGNGH